MEVVWGWQVGCGGMKCVGTHQNTSELWLKAWGRPWCVGMHRCGWEHVSVVGTRQWGVGTACESCGGSWGGAGHMHRGPGDGRMW